MDAAQRAAWLAKRRKTGFGGSDAAAALGLSKFKSQTRLVLEKRGLEEELEDSEFFHWRREMEDPILREYSRRIGLTVVRPTDIVVSQTHPFMFTTYDGIALLPDGKPGRVVQAKTSATRKGWGEPGSDEIPDDYWIQVQHEMFVADLPVADVPCLFYNTKMEIYTVEADLSFRETLIETERWLWHQIQHEPDWLPDPVDIDDAKLRWGRQSKLGRVVASPDVQRAYDKSVKLRAEIEKLSGDLKAEQLVIMRAMELNEALADPDGQLLLTWKAQAGKRTFDAKKCETEFPDAFRACSGRGQPFRKFLYKGES